MQPERTRKVKCEWSSCSDSSPSKYAKLLAGDGPYPVFRRERLFQLETACDSGEPAAAAACGKALTVHSPGSPERSFVAGRKSRASFSEGNSSSESLEIADGSSDGDKHARGSSRPKRAWRVKWPGREERMALAEEPVTRELENYDNDVGCKLTPGTENKAACKEPTESNRKRSVKDQGSRVIYLKALQGVFGTALRPKRQAASPNGVQDESPRRRSESNSRSSSTFSSLEGEQFKLGSSRQKTAANDENCTDAKQKTATNDLEEQQFKRSLSRWKTAANEENQTGTKQKITINDLEEKQQFKRRLSRQKPAANEENQNSAKQRVATNDHEEQQFKWRLSRQKPAANEENQNSAKQRVATNDHEEEQQFKRHLSRQKPAVNEENRNSAKQRVATNDLEGEQLKLGLNRQKTAASDENQTDTKKIIATNENHICTPSVSTQQSNTKEQPLGDRRIVIVEPSPQLVFVDEHSSSSEDDDDIKYKEQDKDPSVGSDWSDMEDAESLATFSQEDSIPCQNSSEILTSSTAENSVTYPAHLYSQPWGGYAKYWTSSPKPSNYRSFSSPSEDTSYPEGSGTSHLCDVSGFSRSTLSNTSEDLESFAERSHHRSSSFDSPLICKEKRKTFSEEPGSYFPVSFRSRLSNSSSSEYANQDFPDELPKYLQGGFIDTHCHLDMLYSKMAFRGTFSKFRKVYDASFPKEFQGCIADFCDPRTLNDFLWDDLLKEDMVWGAFGCHPHFARYYTDLHERNLLQALRHPKAIAFGEMGLDYSYKCTTEVSKQHKVFERQLQLAVSLRKPLVIHCRDADDDLLEIMKKFVPKDYKIHRHCFTGSYNVIEPLLEHFPNLSVGFTALVTYSSAHEARETVKKIPLNRIIVETDAPYFLPRQVPKVMCPYSHPGVALHTVSEIARLRGLPLSVTLAALRQNTSQLYDL
uniref:TatD DNase domain containing 2 n=1 Tax=Sphenodon punctatus TaxID=8508 RepID=A0A8D0HQZ9_SPHPU